jgi:hypothetical protein
MCAAVPQDTMALDAQMWTSVLLALTTAMTMLFALTLTLPLVASSPVHASLDSLATGSPAMTLAAPVPLAPTPTPSVWRRI